jgi:bifunctional DNA-binding transcriptional regulator/antitoxin component of YhaV-PrlF toxin-antitoxin module
MVRLQKRFAYKYKDKEHYKYMVTIPENAVSEAGFKEGEELEPVVEGEKVVLRRPRGGKSSPQSRAQH